MKNLPKEKKMSITEFFQELMEFDKSKFDLNYTGSFKSDVKSCYKSGFDLRLLCDVIKMLAENGFLPAKYRPHLLKGKKLMECHILPDDWLLVWQQNDKELTLLLINTGTHAKILRM